MARKTDRRTIYTINAIKEALLALLNEMPYDKITITRLCQQAEITRTTFYLHFDNLTDVLNLVLDDAFMLNQPDEGNAVPKLELSDNLPLSAMMANDVSLPVCQRVADSEKYRHLLMDPSLDEYIISRIERHVRPQMVPAIMKRTGLAEADAEIIFQYTVHGSFFINRSMGWKKDRKRYHALMLINRFADAGYQAFHK